MGNEGMDGWDRHRASFRPDELVRVPAPVRPCVLRSGGPVMELEAVEGESGVVSWDGPNGSRGRAIFPLACLYACAPVAPADGGDDPWRDAGGEG